MRHPRGGGLRASIRVCPLTLGADGSIDCPDHWAQDLSLPIGSVIYCPESDAVEITVTLDQAWLNWVYFVEVNTEDFCQDG